VVVIIKHAHTKTSLIHTRLGSVTKPPGPVTHRIVVRDKDIMVINKGEPVKATTLRPATPLVNLSCIRNHSIMID
jgi:hypothetical protein